MGSTRKDIRQIWVLILAGMLLFLWGIWEVLHGARGIEDLFFTVPGLIVLIWAAIALARARQPEAAAAVSAQPDPAATAQRRWWIGKLALAIITLLTVAYTATWVARSGTVWMPVLVGGIALVATWTAMIILFRPKVQR